MTARYHTAVPTKISQTFLGELLPIVQKRLVESSQFPGISPHVTLRVVWQKRQAFSTLACLALEDGVLTHHIVLKKIVPTPYNRGLGDAWNLPRANIEYDILEKLYEGFQGMPTCSVPRPLVLLPEHDALVMEYCPGPSLADLFFRAKHFVKKSLFRQLRRYIISVGKWARRFNELTDPTRGGGESVEDIVLFCDRMLGEIASSGNCRVPIDFRTRVMTQIIELRDAIPVDTVPVARKHDDFGPWNMIVSGDRLIVIDFAAAKRGPCCSDLLKMLVFTEDLKQNPIFSSRRLALLQGDLLSAYGYQSVFPHEVVAICEAKHRISSSWHCVTKTPKTIWHKYVTDKILARHIAWLRQVHDAPSLWYRP